MFWEQSNLEGASVPLNPVTHNTLVLSPLGQQSAVCSPLNKVSPLPVVSSHTNPDCPGATMGGSGQMHMRAHCSFKDCLPTSFVPAVVAVLHKYHGSSALIRFVSKLETESSFIVFDNFKIRLATLYVVQKNLARKGYETLKN